MSIKEQIEALKSLSAYDLLLNTEADGAAFTTRVLMSYLKIKYGEDATDANGFFNEEQSNAIAEADSAINNLLKAFTEAYAVNTINRII